LTILHSFHSIRMGHTTKCRTMSTTNIGIGASRASWPVFASHCGPWHNGANMVGFAPRDELDRRAQWAMQAQGAEVVVFQSCLVSWRF